MRENPALYPAGSETRCRPAQGFLATAPSLRFDFWSKTRGASKSRSARRARALAGWLPWCTPGPDAAFHARSDGLRGWASHSPSSTASGCSIAGLACASAIACPSPAPRAAVRPRMDGTVTDFVKVHANGRPRALARRALALRRPIFNVATRARVGVGCSRSRRMGRRPRLRGRVGAASRRVPRRHPCARRRALQGFYAPGWVVARF